MPQAPIGSMTSPMRADSQRLRAAQHRLMSCTQVSRQRPERTPLQLLPAKRAASLHKLAAQRLQAHTQMAAGLAQWALAAPFDPRRVAEATALGLAFWEQWQGLQAQWTDGLAALAEEASELREANTLSKAVAQEVNLMQQALALGSVQAALTLQLLENAQNNLGYWLARRADGADS
jgi:hypothetical protein